jgi:hypothetical protein
MRPTIFTYHENIPTWDHAQLVSVWRRSWQDKGWRAIVVGREAAKQHPLFGAFVKRTRTFPTVNDRQYEEACYVRWLAFAVMIKITDGRALMSDYDVMNLNFHEDNLSHKIHDDVICHETTRVPCLIEATQHGANEIVNFILNREPGPDCGHYSDMYAFKESTWPISNFCLEHGDPRWQEALAVHVASGAVQRAEPGADKTAFIKERWG